MLTPEAKLQIEALLHSVAGASQSLLMLDYDGTLAPFRKDREHAFPYPGISQILQEIVRSEKTRVVIVSGRDAQDVIPLLGIDPHPEVWGLHGRQRLEPHGKTSLPRLDEATTEGLAAADSWLFYQNLQHTAEFKTGSIAVHWRGLDEREVETVRARVLLGWTAIAKCAGLDLLEFDGGLEIRPAGANKGDAVRTILGEMNPQTPAAYLGDDVTDEHAFRAMNGRGVSILVRPRWRATTAQLWLRPPDEVLELLERWLQTCLESGTSGADTTLAVNV